MAATRVAGRPIPTGERLARAAERVLRVLGDARTGGLSVTDADANEIGISVVGASGLVDTARLRPGERVRVGDLQVELAGFDAWVTFLSRRDPGLLVLFGGAAGLCASLAVAFWLPRRRVTVRPVPATGELELIIRGERFDRPADELARLERILRPNA